MDIRKRKQVCVSAGVLFVIGLGLAVYGFANVPGESGRIEISLNVTLGSSLALCGIGVVLLFAFVPNDQRSVLIFATAVAGGMATIYSASYVARALQVGTQRDRISCSVRLIRELDGPQITSVRHFLETEVLPKKMTDGEVYAAIENDEALWNCVRMVSNQIENISLCIQRSYADEEILYKELAHMVPYYYKHLSPFITAIRKKHNYPSMYIEFEELANSWNANRLLCTGRPTPKLD